MEMIILFFLISVPANSASPFPLSPFPLCLIPFFPKIASCLPRYRASETSLLFRVSCSRLFPFSSSGLFDGSFSPKIPASPGARFLGILKASSSAILLLSLSLYAQRTVPPFFFPPPPKTLKRFHATPFRCLLSPFL